MAYLNKSFNDMVNTKSVTADVTLDRTESGQAILVDGSSAGNFTITLPTAEAGLYYPIVLVADSHANTEILIYAGSGSTINGYVLVGTAMGTSGTAVSNRKVGFGDASKDGSAMHLICDGTNWFLNYAISGVTFITNAFS